MSTNPAKTSLVSIMVVATLQTLLHHLTTPGMADYVMARKVVGDKVTLQGNFDPPALYSSVEDIDQAVVEKMCEV